MGMCRGTCYSFDNYRPHRRHCLGRAILLEQWAPSNVQLQNSQPIFQPLMTILITEAGTIYDIFPTGAKEIPKTVNITLDLTGMYVIPGLFDSHAHLSEVEGNLTARLEWALRGGVTSLRDMGGDVVALTPYAQLSLISYYPSPRIYPSALVGSWEFMKDPRVIDSAHGFVPGTIPWFRAITDQTEMHVVAREAKALGVTAVKAYAGLTAPLLAQVTAAVHKNGLRMYSHSTVFPARPSDAVYAGVDVISHSAYLVWESASPVPDDYKERISGAAYANVSYNSPNITALLRLMRRRDTMLDATVMIFLNITEPVARPSTPVPTTRPNILTKNSQLIGDWTANVTRLANQLGVRVVAGTDDMGDPAQDQLPLIHVEMQALVERCGFTPVQALAAATCHGAAALGIEADFGTVEVGKVADLLVLRANPLENIRNTRSIASVIKEGVVF
jgi:imidazolonepropionase-like amidohydrolase